MEWMAIYPARNPFAGEQLLNCCRTQEFAVFVILVPLKMLEKKLTEGRAIPTMRR